MEDDRQLREAIARCVAAMVYHLGVERAGDPDRFLEREARGLLPDLERCGPDDRERERLVLGPVESELASRYGPEIGADLCRRLREALRAAREAGAGPP